MTTIVGLRRPLHLALCSILLVSGLARTALIFSGGQLYWPDEDRYESAQKMVRLAVEGNLREAIGWLDEADHLLFKAIGVVPATVEGIAGQDVRIPALFFSMFSVVNILLVWRIARRAGADDAEALIAAGLFAASATFFYYSRHLVPYDVAMTFGLLAIDVGFKPAPRVRDSLLCGLLAGCAFLTYAGYWTLTAAAILLHVTHHRPSPRDGVRRAVVAVSGSVAPVASAILLSEAVDGYLLASYFNFSGAVTQGTFQEGWRLPFEYLWHAEHFLIVLWATCVASSLWNAASGRAPARIRSSLIALGLIYGAFVLCSVVLERFVVYGRLARQLVPFLALITAHELERLRMSSVPLRTVLVPALVLVVLLQAVVNFRQPMQMVFPKEFQRALRPAVAQLASDSYRWVNVGHIYPAPEQFALSPRHVLISEAPHPLEFLPYQYEGYTPAERHVLRSSDLTMRLVVAARPDVAAPRAPR